MVHIGGAIASELTWMHGKSATSKLPQDDGVGPPQSTWRENVLNVLRPKAWAFVSGDCERLFS